MHQVILSFHQSSRISWTQSINLFFEYYFKIRIFYLPLAEHTTSGGKLKCQIRRTQNQSFRFFTIQRQDKLKLLIFANSTPSSDWIIKLALCFSNYFFLLDLYFEFKNKVILWKTQEISLKEIFFWIKW